MLVVADSVPIIGSPQVSLLSTSNTSALIEASAVVVKSLTLTPEISA